MSDTVEFAQEDVNKVKEKILEVVSKHPGVKAVELVSNPDLWQSIAEGYDLPELIDNLVESGNLIEIEYITEVMPYRIKSIYFPAMTEFPNIFFKELKESNQ